MLLLLELNKDDIPLGYSVVHSAGSNFDWHHEQWNFGIASRFYSFWTFAGRRDSEPRFLLTAHCSPCVMFIRWKYRLKFLNLCFQAADSQFTTEYFICNSVNMAFNVHFCLSHILLLLWNTFVLFKIIFAFLWIFASICSSWWVSS